MKYRFIVSCSPQKITKRDLRDYIEEACDNWNGCYRLDDPLFGKHDFTVKHFPLTTKGKLKTKTKQNTNENNKRTTKKCSH